MHNKSKKKLTFNVVVYILVIVCTILSLFPTFFAFLLAVLKEKNRNKLLFSLIILHKPIKSTNNSIFS